MRLKYKVSLPLVVVMALLAVGGYLLEKRIMGGLEGKTVTAIEQGKVATMGQAVERASVEALGMASVFSRLPAVIAAFEVAHQGDIRSEADPKAQEARELLRKDLKPMLAGFQAAMGDKLKLHFHLPSGRSLARLWRDKQIQRDGKWLDISDDISPFRPSVLDVNKTGAAVKGIELGSGGFEIRGVVPVKDEAGRQLGSVEVLLPFEPIIAAASEGEGQDMLLYIPAEGLKIATGLKDPQKNPLVGSEYVLASGKAKPEISSLVTAEFLADAKGGPREKRQGALSLTAFPIKDYKGQPAGIMVHALDTSALHDTVRQATLSLMGLLAGALAALLGVVWVIIGRMVTSPVQAVVGKIKEIADGRANLKERLNDSQNDEIGELAAWFNRLMGKIDEMMCSVEGMANMVNAVPDPIFSVDDDYRIIYANKATETFLGKDIEALRKGCCHEFFQTKVCRTDKCPIALAKQVQGSFKAEVIDIGKPGAPVYIQPVGDLLRDCEGKKVGYVEVARVVTDQVLKAQELERNMLVIQNVNEKTQDAAARIASASEQIMGRLGEVNQGASHQRDRAAETATAMEEMNATVLEVARSASSAAEQAEATRRKAAEGAEVVHKAVAAIEEVRQLAGTMKKNMGELGNRADNIGQIMGVISDIADQTNLLALNAAIEAARAGEAGRGFAVVADEVRKLAEKTMTATKEVGSAIGAIQQGTGESIRDMDAAATAVDQAVSLANRSGEALHEIVSLVVASTDQVRSIATAAEQQSSTSEEINRAVDEVNRIAGETAQGMGESVQALSDLAHLAEDLRDLSRSR